MTGRFVRFDAGPDRVLPTRPLQRRLAGIREATADSDIVEARLIEIVPNVRVVQAVDFVSATPPGISREDHTVGLASSLDNLAMFLES